MGGSSSKSTPVNPAGPHWEVGAGVVGTVEECTISASVPYKSSKNKLASTYLTVGANGGDNGMDLHHTGVGRKEKSQSNGEKPSSIRRYTDMVLKDVADLA